MEVAVKRVAKDTTNKKVTRKANTKVARMNDPIRIVPLHVPSELYRPSAGIAALQSHNSPTTGDHYWIR